MVANVPIIDRLDDIPNEPNTSGFPSINVTNTPVIFDSTPTHSVQGANHITAAISQGAEPPHQEPFIEEVDNFFSLPDDHATDH